VTPAFFAAIGLNLPTTARHGGIGTVDVGGHGIDGSDYTFGSGAAIRFVCELDPVKGPIARNALPGGEIFDPASPHYKDFFDLWKKNQTANLAYQRSEVVAGAKQELQKNGLGRTRFTQ
jgi:penicillin G amidase